MRQFFDQNDEAFRDLEQRSSGRCIRFRSREMPPGCLPDRADIAFELDARCGSARLLIQRGLHYAGSDSSVRHWIATGVKEFPTFAALRNWIQGPLREAFQDRTAMGRRAVEGAANPRAVQELTDMSVVQQGVRDLHRPLYLDEEKLVDRMRRRVLGQEGALKSLAGVLVRHCARRRPARPAVVFAVGPSGVGKTRTAEVMAEILREFDDVDNGYQFLRLDMTEYQEAHRVSQLIGSPQGYVGHGEGSQLLDALRANPRTIVLFDEIEKAHPAILRVLMNAMDAGRLSTASRTSSGREIDCRHAMFMFTSNLDAKSMLDELESREAFGDRAVEDEVCRRRLHAAGIAPEIVGRIGRFIVYRPLSPEIRAEIVALGIADVAAEYGLNITYIEPAVIVEIMEKARSETFGVRPERFLIDDVLGAAFAQASACGTPNPLKVTGPPYECVVHPELGATDCVDGRGAGGTGANANRQTQTGDG